MSATLELKPIPEAAPAAPAASQEPDILAIVKAQIEGGADMAKLTALYLKLRNKKKDLDTLAKQKAAPLTASMDLIEAKFLATMQELGTDSLKNASGTPYKTIKTSITIADGPAYMDFVLTRALAGLTVSDAAKEKIKEAMIESGQLSLIEARAAKTAVEQLMMETQMLPDGLAKRDEVAVNVRAD